MDHKEMISLYDLPIGAEGRVVSLEVSGVMRRRLLDLGLVPNSLIKAVRRSPAGDPTAYRVRGTTIGLRMEEASKILINRL
ncbi:FeoA family protein [Ammoniphilus resinae]|uniref:Ferrous iron transport protein A n=1 Tax=Ammoniphilus resinae TaxID=861532 RepID=A0ABS4GRL1_9BACL|nr:FeoA family protein [Ammoniphilus resinae]MBP1932899.1 ferrous iron transport protein A [Ammoniphilus resinae]